MVIARLILLVAKLCTKCEVSSFGRCIDILGGVKFYNVSRDPDHASFRDDVSPAGWDLLRLTYRPNLKLLATPRCRCSGNIAYLRFREVSGLSSFKNF